MTNTGSEEFRGLQQGFAVTLKDVRQNREDINKAFDQCLEGIAKAEEKIKQAFADYRQGWDQAFAAFQKSMKRTLRRGTSSNRALGLMLLAAATVMALLTLISMIA